MTDTVDPGCSWEQRGSPRNMRYPLHFPALIWGPSNLSDPGSAHLHFPANFCPSRAQIPNSGPRLPVLGNLPPPTHNPQVACWPSHSCSDNFAIIYCSYLYRSHRELIKFRARWHPFSASVPLTSSHWNWNQIKLIAVTQQALYFWTCLTWTPPW
jgi:hypothetical protein